MSTKDSFKIISVAGAHSKVGKTTLCSILLRELNEFGAIKFTKTVLHTLVVDEIEKLNQKGKDTAILLESGAKKVIWIQCPQHTLKESLEVAISKVIDLKGVIVEGNSPVDFLNPHLVIFIIGQNGQIKPSALKVSKRANIVIINSEKQVKPPPFSASLLQKNTKDAKRPKIFWINLIERQGEIEELLCFVKKKLWLFRK